MILNFLSLVSFISLSINYKMVNFKFKIATKSLLHQSIHMNLDYTKSHNSRNLAEDNQNEINFIIRNASTDIDRVSTYESAITDKLISDRIDRISFNTIIQSYLNLNKFDEAQKALYFLSANNITIEADTVNILLKNSFRVDPLGSSADKLYISYFTDKNLFPNSRTLNV